MMLFTFHQDAIQQSCIQFAAFVSTLQRPKDASQVISQIVKFFDSLEHRFVVFPIINGEVYLGRNIPSLDLTEFIFRLSVLTDDCIYITQMSNTSSDGTLTKNLCISNHFDTRYGELLESLFFVQLGGLTYLDINQEWDYTGLGTLRSLIRKPSYLSQNHAVYVQPQNLVVEQPPQQEEMCDISWDDSELNSSSRIGSIRGYDYKHVGLVHFFGCIITTLYSSLSVQSIALCGMYAVALFDYDPHSFSLSMVLMMVNQMVGQDYFYAITTLYVMRTRMAMGFSGVISLLATCGYAALWTAFMFSVVTGYVFVLLKSFLFLYFAWTENIFLMTGLLSWQLCGYVISKDWYISKLLVQKHKILDDWFKEKVALFIVKLGLDQNEIFRKAFMAGFDLFNLNADFNGFDALGVILQKIDPFGDRKRLRGMNLTHFQKTHYTTIDLHATNTDYHSMPDNCDIGSCITIALMFIFNQVDSRYRDSGTYFEFDDEQSLVTFWSVHMSLFKTWYEKTLFDIGCTPEEKRRFNSKWKKQTFIKKRKNKTLYAVSFDYLDMIFLDVKDLLDLMEKYGITTLKASETLGEAIYCSPTHAWVNFNKLRELEIRLADQARIQAQQNPNIPPPIPEVAQVPQQPQEDQDRFDLVRWLQDPATKIIALNSNPLQGLQPYQRYNEVPIGYFPNCALYKGLGCATVQEQDVAVILHGVIYNKQRCGGFSYSGNPLNTYQIGFNLFITKDANPTSVMECARPADPLTVFTSQGFQVPLRWYQDLQNVAIGLSITWEQKEIIVQRYLDSLSPLRYEEGNAIVTGDIYGEYRVMLLSVCNDIQQRMILRHKNYLNLDNKPEWYQVLCVVPFFKNMSWIPKDGEQFSHYIIRSYKIDPVVLVYVQTILTFISDEEVVQAMRLLISVHLRFKSIVRDNIIGGTIDFMFSIKDRIDDIRGQRRIAGVSSYSVHKHPNLETWYNQFSIRKYKVYNLYSKIEASSYNFLQRLCTCSKNICKYAITNISQPMYTSFVQYASCPYNAVSSVLYRQGASKLSPQPHVTRRFRRFVMKQNLPRKFLRSLRYYTKQDLSWDTYIAKIRESSNAKADRYILGRATAIIRRAIDLTFKCFPKVGEFFIKNDCDQLSSMSNRPRNISNPDITVLGCCNHVNFIMLKLLKKSFPQYSSYHNIGDLQKKLSSDYARLSLQGKVHCLSTDFSSHDSNQHAVFLQIVDNYLFEKTLPTLWKYLDLPDYMYSEVMKALTKIELDFQFKMKFRNRYMTLFKYTQFGGVPSGHPTRTTFGNTLRVILYYEFIMDELGILQVHYRMYVGGDDFYLLISERYFTLFMNHIFNYFSKSGVGCHGLGQQVKKVNDLGHTGIDFLSKVGVFHNGEAYIFRNLPRIAFLQCFTDSRCKDLATLIQAMTCSMFCSGYDLKYIQTRVKQIGGSIAKMTEFEYRNSITLIHNQDPSRAIYYAQNFKAYQQDSSLEERYMDAIKITGDMQGISRTEYQGMVQDIQDNVQNGWYQKFRKAYVSRIRGVYGGGWATQKQYKSLSQSVTNMLGSLDKCSRKNFSITEEFYRFESKPANFVLSKQDLSLKIDQTSQEPSRVSQGASTVKRPIVNHLLLMCPDCSKCRIYFQWLKQDNLCRCQGQNYSDIQRLGSTKVVTKKEYIKKTKPQNQPQLTVTTTTVNKGQKQKKNKGNKRKNNSTVKSMDWFKKSSNMKMKMTPYTKSVLFPWSTTPVMPPYDFNLQTSTLEFEGLLKFSLMGGDQGDALGTYGAYIKILPHAFQSCGTINARDYNTNATYKYLTGHYAGQNFINISRNGVGGSADFSNGWALSGQGIKSVTSCIPGFSSTSVLVSGQPSPLASYYGLSSSGWYQSYNTVGTSVIASANTAARWSSARVVRLGIKLVPVSSQTVRNGSLLMCQIPGRYGKFSPQLVGSIPNSSSATYAQDYADMMPDANALRAYPNCSVFALGTTEPQWNYVWLPTDPMDNVFCNDQLDFELNQNSTLIPTTTNTGEDIVYDHGRNPIFLYLTADTPDKYILEYKVTYEYVPVPGYKAWSSPVVSRSTPADQTNLKQNTLQPESQTLETPGVMDALGQTMGNLGNFVLDKGSQFGAAVLTNMIENKINSQGIYRDQPRSIMH